MFKAGARAGSETVVALADDIHAASKLAVSSKEGAGLAVLRAMFPTTAVAIECNVEKIDKLEMSLFPTLPEDNENYIANVENPIMMEGGVEGYLCCIPMRPPYRFSVEHPHPKNGGKHPSELRVKCIEASDEAWKVLGDDEIDFIIEYK